MIPKAKASITYGSFSVYPESDTQTREVSGDYNYDPSLDSLLCQDDNRTGSDKGYGWFRFYLGDHGTITIYDAKLYIYCHYVLPDPFVEGQYTLKSIDTSNETWNPSNITWNTQPTLNVQEEPYYRASVSAVQWYSWQIINDSGSSTYGIGALQDAYTNNRTKTYVLNVYESGARPTGAYWRSIEKTSYEPRLEVFYSLTTTEDEESPPNLINAKLYELIFYVKNDSGIDSSNGSKNMGDWMLLNIAYNDFSGQKVDLLSKFNISFPDLINGQINTNMSLTNKTFQMIEFFYYQYCEFHPEDEFIPYDAIYGISRSNESWLETTVSWNTKPFYRERLNIPKVIDKDGWFFFDIINDENFVRFSINNETTYTVVHKVEEEFNANNYATWRLKEYLPEFRTYLRMRIWSGDLAIVEALPTELGFFTAHIWLANAWRLNPFIAGNLLCLMILSVTIVPIGLLTRNPLWIMIFTLMFCTLFMVFGWMHIGIYTVILLFTILIVGKVIKL